MKPPLRRLAVEGMSMAPTLLPGDHLLVVALRQARIGQLVVLADPRGSSRLLVKRVVDLSESGVSLAGDNPAASTDSRTFGPVAPSSLRGRVAYRYWPPNRAGRLGTVPGGR